MCHRWGTNLTHDTTENGLQKDDDDEDNVPGESVLRPSVVVSELCHWFLDSSFRLSDFLRTAGLSKLEWTVLWWEQLTLVHLVEQIGRRCLWVERGGEALSNALGEGHEPLLLVSHVQGHLVCQVSELCTEHLGPRPDTLWVINLRQYMVAFEITVSSRRRSNYHSFNFTWVSCLVNLYFIFKSLAYYFRDWQLHLVHKCLLFLLLLEIFFLT